ncbi:MAG: hypothetical protein GNW80_07060 [Asgard group archaeon]|nr:hypothetical protein [Asgard group archaeon]
MTKALSNAQRNVKALIIISKNNKNPSKSVQAVQYKRVVTMSKDVQVKNFRITFLRKPLKNKIKYEVDVRALTKEDALHQAYSRIGSKHKAPRQLLQVKSIKEISAHDIKNNILKEIATDDDVKIH